MAVAIVMDCPPGGGKTNPVRILVGIGFAKIVSSDIIDAYLASLSDEEKERIRKERHGAGLVNTPLVISLVKAKLNDIPWDQNIVLDGFPRDGRQVDFLVDYLTARECEIIVAQIDVPDDVCVTRVAGRRKEKITAGEEPRPEDEPDVHAGRLITYRDNWPAVNARYRHYGITRCRIDGTKPMDVVASEVVSGFLTSTAS